MASVVKEASAGLSRLNFGLGYLMSRVTDAVRDYEQAGSISAVISKHVVGGAPGGDEAAAAESPAGVSAGSEHAAAAEPPLAPPPPPPYSAEHPTPASAVHPTAAADPFEGLAPVAPAAGADAAQMSKVELE